MRITCEKCNAVYSIAEKIIGSSGRIVKCAKCSHNWMALPLSESQKIPQIPLPKKKNLRKEPENYSLKLISILLLIASITVISFLFFSRDLIKYKPLEAIYNSFSVYDNSGIKLKDFTYKIDYTDIIINGILINDSLENKKVPNIRYTLLDKNKKIVFTSTVSRDQYILKPNTKLPVTYKINNVRKPVKYLQIDIGNKLELLLGSQ
ncbi:MAG: zinc-ribbon domain-containing protein [Rickettsiales bacterium]|jgi:predicted Zn finger-like uncharacterized protein|nr:zinc-ribbon domain-containing protein [Rickettsiales bacterium]